MRAQASHVGVEKKYCYRTDTLNWFRCCPPRAVAIRGENQSTDTRTKKFRSGYCQSTGNSDFTYKMILKVDW